jgi:hypothetical protein
MKLSIKKGNQNMAGRGEKDYVPKHFILNKSRK